MTEVRKMAHLVPVSLDMALDLGIITEAEARARGWTPYVATPVTFRTRLRRARWALTARLPRVHFGPCDTEDA